MTNLFNDHYMIYDSAKRVMETYPSPFEMDDLSLHAVSDALDTLTAASLLALRSDYTTQQWWQLAEVATSTTARDTAMALAVIAVPKTKGIETENAAAAGAEALRRVMHAGEDHPGFPFFALISHVIADHPDEPDMNHALGVIGDSIYSNFGQELVANGEITQDELIDALVASESNASDLDKELADAVEDEEAWKRMSEGKRPANNPNSGRYGVWIHITNLTYLDDEDDLASLRYIFESARESMIGLIATDTFSPSKAANSQAAKDLAEDCMFEPVLMGLIAEFEPSVRVLSHIYEVSGHETMAHVNLASAIGLAVTHNNLECFKEASTDVMLTPALEADRDLSEKIISDAASVKNPDVSLDQLTTWSDLYILLYTTTVSAMQAVEQGDEEAKKEADRTITWALHPFGKTVASTLRGYGVPEVDSYALAMPEKTAAAYETCELVRQVLAGDDDMADRLRRSGREEDI